MCGSDKLRKTKAISLSLLAVLGAAGSVSVAVLRAKQTSKQSLPGLTEDAGRAIALLRGPASTKFFGKPTNHYNLEAAVNFEQSDAAKGIWQVESTITGAGNVKGYNYAWILPKGAQILTGSVEGEVVGLGAGEIQSLQIVLRLAPEETDRRVILRLFTDESGVRFGNATALVLEPSNSNTNAAQANTGQMKTLGAPQRKVRVHQ